MPDIVCDYRNDEKTPGSRPGVEATGRSFRSIFEGLGVEEPVVPPAYLCGSGGDVAGHCFRPVFEGLGDRGSSPSPLGP